MGGVQPHENFRHLSDRIATGKFGYQNARFAGRLMGSLYGIPKKEFGENTSARATTAPPFPPRNDPSSSRNMAFCTACESLIKSRAGIGLLFKLRRVMLVL